MSPKLTYLYSEAANYRTSPGIKLREEQISLTLNRAAEAKVKRIS